MSSEHDHPENLGVRARRGALLPGEQAELGRVLDASPELRAAFRIGDDFDRVAAVQAGDEQLIARFVSAALAARRARPARRTPRRLVWLAAAAVLAVCGAAFAVRATLRQRALPVSAAAHS